jgi:hypothetical protein
MSNKQKKKKNKICPACDRELRYHENLLTEAIRQEIYNHLPLEERGTYDLLKEGFCEVLALNNALLWLLGLRSCSMTPIAKARRTPKIVDTQRSA